MKLRFTGIYQNVLSSQIVLFIKIKISVFLYHVEIIAHSNPSLQSSGIASLSMSRTRYGAMEGNTFCN